MALTKPTQITVPFASSGLKNTIPETATGSNRASMQEGFPAITMQDVDQGGMAPYGQDMNGIIYDVTKAIQYQQAGGLFPYDATFAAAIDGYPIGAIVTSADGTQLFQNTLDGNQSDPENDGANWSNIMTSASLAGKQDKLNQTQMDAVNSGITSAKVAIYDSYASTKQNTLTFDNAPTNGSTNPVTSDGIYAALGTKQDTIAVDATPASGSTNPVQSGGVYSALADKVDIAGGNSSATVATATGSTAPRTLANRFADVVNVKDFGAKGDGVTDDRAALNAAFAYAAQHGKTVLMDGQYLITSGAVKIPSNSHIIGSPNTRIIRGYNTAGGHAYLADIEPITGESEIYDVTIEGIIFDGNGGNFDAVSFDILAWSGYPASNIVLRDCEFWNIIDFHAIDVEWTDGLLIDNCKFKGWVHKYSDDGVATRREMIQLQGSVGATYQNKNIIIQNCWFGASDEMDAPPAGIGNHGWEDALGSDVVKDIIIRNNTFVGCSWYGVSVFGWQNILVDGNTFLNCRALGLQSRLASDSADNDAIVKNVTFVHNTCRRDTQGSEAMQFWIPGGYASLVSRYTDITDTFPQDILIEGNTFDNYNASAVFVVGKNVRFVNNDVYRGSVNFFRTNGIEISGNTLRSSYIWNAATSGYFTATDYPETDDCKKNYIIRNNFLRELRQRSIYIGNTNAGVDVSNNFVFNRLETSSNATAPIEIVSNNKIVSIHDNTFINLQPYRIAFISLVQDDTYTVYANRYTKQGVVTNPYLNTVVESYVPSSLYQALEARVAALEA